MKGKFRFSIEIDAVKYIAGKVQYLCAHVATSEKALSEESEEISKLNDGPFGGSHDV